MDQNQVILQFRFATFGDSMLRKMNLLRHQRRFCDVTVRLNQLEVPGHKVVFAAGSSFLRDQFILQQDSSGEVQITMTQEAEVGRQLLLSCYTGQLVFPELELVHYLAVASFLQMSHIVDQCTQALSKFIKPLPPRPPGTGTEVDAEADVDAERDRRRRRRKDEGSLQREHQHQHHSPTQTVHKQEDLEDNYVINDNDGEDYDDDDDDVIIQPATSAQRGGRKEDGDITIVKVESISEAAASDMEEHAAATPSGRFPSGPPPAALRPPEPQHSLINSTVETRGGELLGPATSMSGYPLSPQQAAPGGGAAPPLLLAGRHGHAHGHGHGQGGAHKPPQWYHQCPKCARVFRQLENYANHLKMHKMFMCLLCGKTFTQKGNLHRHMRVHAGIKPFQCKICGKNFTQKCSLLDHLNLHSGDKPHRCNYCDMVFAHKPVLRKHLKQVHGKNSFDNANERSVHDGGLDVGLDGRLLDGGLDVRLDGGLDGGLDVRLDGGLDVRLDGGLDVRLDGTLDFDYGHKTDL